jgi:hypothetical protein
MQEVVVGDIALVEPAKPYLVMVSSFLVNIICDESAAIKKLRMPTFVVELTTRVVAVGIKTFNGRIMMGMCLVGIDQTRTEILQHCALTPGTPHFKSESISWQN